MISCPIMKMCLILKIYLPRIVLENQKDRVIIIQDFGVVKANATST